ncbi:MAG: helix-hairpin-helix domain-containing protein [Desulfobacterota bacterium]|nr:helix-hairpin-helix domain-containing protein [Thermodesulfobacteriota bacterium]
MGRLFRKALLRIRTLLTSYDQPPLWRHLPIRKSLSLTDQWILFGLASFLLGLFYIKFHPSSLLPSEQDRNEIVVEVEGEVHRPGIYTFSSPPRLKEVIQVARGLKEPAWLDEDSSSLLLESGTLVTVRPSPSLSPDEGAAKSGRTIRIEIGRMEARKLLLYRLPLDLNRATAEDLCLLPGIGESLAREIVAYRERRRGFRSVEELKEVKGIGEKKWINLKPYLTVDLR